MKDQKLKEDIQEAVRPIMVKFAYEENNEETRNRAKKEVEDCLKRFKDDKRIWDFVVSCSEREQADIQNNQLDLSFGIKELGSEENGDFSMFSVVSRPASEKDLANATSNK